MMQMRNHFAFASITPISAQLPSRHISRNQGTNFDGGISMMRMLQHPAPGKHRLHSQQPLYIYGGAFMLRQLVSRLSIKVNPFSAIQHQGGRHNSIKGFAVFIKRIHTLFFIFHSFSPVLLRSTLPKWQYCAQGQNFNLFDIGTLRGASNDR